MMKMHQQMKKIFNFTTSSNNRDGLAIRAASLGLLEREEERKIMIILSDGTLIGNRSGLAGAKSSLFYQAFVSYRK